MTLYDPNRAKVKSLLQGNGANNATVFTDLAGGTWTAVGNAKISTARSQWGGSSMAFDGASDAITRSSGLALGTLNFTIDAWIYVASLTTKFTIYDSRGATTNNGVLFFVNNNGALQTELRDGTTVVNGPTSAAGVITTGQFIFVEFVRIGTTYYIFAGGVLVASKTATITNSFSNASGRIGWVVDSNTTYSANGNINDFRLTVDLGRNSATFTPPADQFDLRGVIVSGTVQKGDPAAPASRKVTLIRSSDNLAIGTGISDPSTGNYSIATNADAGEMLYGMAAPDYGFAPVRNQAYIVDAKCWVGSPAPNGHWYQCEQAGTTGSTEPTWPTDGSTVTDGTVIWRDKGVMERPWAEGPYIALAA